MPEAVIVSATRTPIGRAGKGSLIDVRPDDLGAFAIKKALEKVPELNGAEIEDAYIDHVINVAGGNKTRAAQLLGIARETLRSRMIARNAESPLSGGRTA